MNYWIFIVTTKKAKNQPVTGRNIFETRMKDKFWGIGLTTPNRKQVRKGDRVVFYVGVPERVFGGEATLASAFFQLNRSEKEKWQHDKNFFNASHGVKLTENVIWRKPIPVADLIQELGFIENKEHWGTYFQGGIRQISEDDYILITTGAPKSLSQRLELTKDIESESEFALESHLEEFIYENWSSIRWGSHLDFYETEDQNGRQFPAGLWSIDFLAVDRKNNDLVVIELKKGKTSDATVGQTLRYVNWIKENIAKHNQKVRGIIVAREVNDALRYAAKDQPSIDIKTYDIKFSLKSQKL